MSIHPDQIERGGDYLNKGVKYTRTDLIPAMIQAAVDAEREACAMAAAHYGSGDALSGPFRKHRGHIAAAIRARKGGAE